MDTPVVYANLDEACAVINTLTRILYDAIKNGYHACDETVSGWDEPRGKCSCWISLAKLEIDWVDPDLAE